MDLYTLQLQLQRSPGFCLTIQPRLSIPPLLPQNLKSFPFQASRPSRHMHFSKIFPVSTHHLIWLLSPLSPPTPLHDTQPFFSAPLSPHNLQIYSKVPEPWHACSEQMSACGGTDRMTQNTASSTEEHLFLCVRTQLHSQISGNCPNVSVLVEGPCKGKKVGDA